LTTPLEDRLLGERLLALIDVTPRDVRRRRLAHAALIRLERLLRPHVPAPRGDRRPA
jgi:hypothetical protein